MVQKATSEATVGLAAPQIRFKYLDTSFLEMQAPNACSEKEQMSEDMTDFFLRNAAGAWIQNYEDEESDSFWHPSHDDMFVWRARQIYHNELARRGVGPQREARKPLHAVCNDFPDDGIPTLYTHMGEDGRVLYIGKSMKVKKRQQMHRQNSYWWNKVHGIEFDPFPNELSLGLAEIAAIKRYRPKYNKDHNGGRL